MGAQSGAWAHAIVSRNWDALLAVAGDESRMPQLQGPPSRRGARRIKLHGCGHYGCVAPTASAGVVFKITSDPDEAGFVEAWLRVASTDPAPGTVRYHAVAELPERRRNRPVYAIWREEALSVGTAMPHFSKLSGWVDLFKVAAHHARSLTKKAPDSRSFTVEAVRLADRLYLSYGEVEDASRLRRRLKFESDGYPLRGADSAAASVAACRMFAEALQSRSETSLLGSELLRWLDLGVLLCDVHRGNLGRAVRGVVMEVVITDPGHALLLDSTFDELRVPSLEAAAKRGWSP